MGILKSVLRGTVRAAGFGTGVASGTATKINEGIDVMKVSIDESLKESLTAEEKAAVDKLFHESKDSGESLTIKGITGVVDTAAVGLSGVSRLMDRLTREINSKADEIIKASRETEGGSKEGEVLPKEPGNLREEMKYSLIKTVNK